MSSSRTARPRAKIQRSGADGKSLILTLTGKIVTSPRTWVASSRRAILAASQYPICACPRESASAPRTAARRRCIGRLSGSRRYGVTHGPSAAARPSHSRLSNREHGELRARLGRLRAHCVDEPPALTSLLRRFLMPHSCPALISISGINWLCRSAKLGAVTRHRAHDGVVPRPALHLRPAAITSTTQRVYVVRVLNRQWK
jgi:hypothetical protein